MKRILTFAFLALAAATLSAKTKLTVKNTVGADSDEVGDWDLLTRSDETDISGKTTEAKTFAFGDRFQIDMENKTVSGRFRLESLYHKTSVTNDGESTGYDDEIPSLLFVPSGFVHFTPISQFGVVAGNNFYKHFAIQSAYLAAADDTTKYGRLLTDSLGEDRYFGSDSVAIYSNGFAGGVTSDWNFGGGIYAKFAGGGTFYPEKNSDGEIPKAIDFGANGGIANLFDFGFTAHDVTEDSRKFGAFAGYTGNRNLILNAGFYYNFTASDYLPEERVTGSDDDDNDIYKYKKQTAKYALGLSGGYKFEGIGLGIYGDVISGLTNEYIGKIKYYDTDGNLIDTKTASIARGSTIVKYYYNKKGTKAKSRGDKFTHEGIPFYAGLRLTYQFTPIVEGLLNFKVRTLLNAGDTTWITLYPRLKINAGERGSVGAGVRLDMNEARSAGLSGISVPLTYTYKFKKKF